MTSACSNSSNDSTLGTTTSGGGPSNGGATSSGGAVPASGGTTSSAGGSTGGKPSSGGSTSAGGATTAGGAPSSGGSNPASGGAGAAESGGSGAGGSGSGGVVNTGGSGGGSSGAGGAVDGGANPCGSTPCLPTRCAGVGCGPAVCCPGPNEPICIHGASECPLDGGVRTETLQCFGGGATAAFARSCTRDADCFVASHYSGCCHVDALGLNVAEQAAFDAFDAKCGGAPACDCCCDRVYTESGSVVSSGTAISVACVGGVCTTTSP